MKKSATFPSAALRLCVKFAVLLLLPLLLGCRQEGATWQRIQESGVVRVGLDPTYPPFEVADADGLHGLDVDLAKALAAEWGITAEFVLFGYDGLYDALATEQVDLLISALVIAPERTRDFAYSEPYFNAGQLLIVPQTETEIAEMRDLDGRSLAVELGSQGHVEATTWQRRLADLTVLPLAAPDAAITAVADGAADAALVDAISARLALAERPSLLALPQPVTVEPFAVVVRIDDETLLENVNEALATLQQSGNLDAITRRWLDQPAP